ncbi:MAG: hypothetical protein A2073_03750 [Deltaproteobacteria bacterium GWC2_42_11]|nr:MAG: hypothetical protein A2073_03750 [Deltaproteobacteria bacterium GWC2_42_11]HBO83937.1 plastocyanin [Deltaproteobacteria bacterium]
MKVNHLNILLLAAACISLSSPAFADEVVVKMKDWLFKPAAITIKAGDTVVWVHEDEDDPHNVIFEDASIKGSETIKYGKQFKVVFDKAGEYKYYCRFHRDNGMRGVVIVK